MICLACKKQIPDDSSVCPHCGSQVHPKHQLDKEISFRRWQRWFFYVVLGLTFLGMLALAIKLYSLNTELLLETANVRGDLEENVAVKEELKKKNQEYLDLKVALEQENGNLKNNLALETEKLNVKTSEYAKEFDEKERYKTSYDSCLIDYNVLSGNYRNLIGTLSVGISNANLSKILLADFNLNTSDDADGDGLSDMIEEALGTNVNLMDSDSDGYSDKAEVLAGFNPLGAGNLPINNDFAVNNRGRVFSQVESGNQVWFIGKDGKRYFLGKNIDLN